MRVRIVGCARARTPHGAPMRFGGLAAHLWIKKNRGSGQNYEANENLGVWGVGVNVGRGEADTPTKGGGGGDPKGITF